MEDDVPITENGRENRTADIPKIVEQIEPASANRSASVWW
jgi:hypothetical protein